MGKLGSSLLEEVTTGVKALRMLKYAVGIVLVGGGAAFSAAKLTVKSVDDRVTVTNTQLEEHLKVDHPALNNRLDRMETKVDNAGYDSQRAAANSEAALRYMGVPVPRVERRHRDAGE